MGAPGGGRKFASSGGIARLDATLEVGLLGGGLFEEATVEVSELGQSSTVFIDSFGGTDLKTTASAVSLPSIAAAQSSMNVFLMVKALGALSSWPPLLSGRSAPPMPTLKMCNWRSWPKPKLSHLSWG
jgi:hypothetical protein